MNTNTTQKSLLIIVKNNTEKHAHVLTEQSDIIVENLHSGTPP